MGGVNKEGHGIARHRRYSSAGMPQRDHSMRQGLYNASCKDLHSLADLDDHAVLRHVDLDDLAVLSLAVETYSWV